MPPLPPGYERDNGVAERRDASARSSHEDMLDYARSMGFGEALRAAPLIWRRFHGTERWDHEHCLVCFARFIDPDLGPRYTRWLSEDPSVLTEGYTTAPAPAPGQNEPGEWLCADCYGEYGHELGLTTSTGAHPRRGDAHQRRRRHHGSSQRSTNTALIASQMITAA